MNEIWGILFLFAIILGMGDCQDFQIFTTTKIVAVGIVILLIIWGIFDPQIDWIDKRFKK